MCCGFQRVCLTHQPFGLEWVSRFQGDLCQRVERMGNPGSAFDANLNPVLASKVECLLAKATRSAKLADHGVQ